MAVKASWKPGTWYVGGQGRPGPPPPPKQFPWMQRAKLGRQRPESNTLNYLKTLECRKIKYYIKHRSQKRKRL